MYDDTFNISRRIIMAVAEALKSRGYTRLSVVSRGETPSGYINIGTSAEMIWMACCDVEEPVICVEDGYVELSPEDGEECIVNYTMNLDGILSPIMEAAIAGAYN